MDVAVYDRIRRGYRVFIGDLGTNIGRYEIEKEFKQYGPITDTWVARNPPGFAFLVFKYAEDAETAVRKVHGRRIAGRRIKVEHARPFEERRRLQMQAEWNRPAYRYSSQYSRSGSRDRYRSRSRDRKRSRSKDCKTRSVSQDRRDSRSPDHLGSLSPDHKRSRSPNHKRSRSPNHKRSRTPKKRSRKSKRSRSRSGSQTESRKHKSSRTSKSDEKSKNSVTPKKEKNGDVDGSKSENSPRKSEDDKVANKGNESDD